MNWGLLYVYYLLKTHGIKVLYLGANMPLKDVEFVCQDQKALIIFIRI